MLRLALREKEGVSSGGGRRAEERVGDTKE